MLIVVEDRHAEGAVRNAIATVRARGGTATVLTSDALLAMRLRREGPGDIDARLTIDGLTRDTLDERDGLALDGVAAACGHYATALGTDFGPYLQYTLIPAFIRAVRNITAVADVLTADERIIVVGGGALVEAARLVALRRGVFIETVGGGVFDRWLQALARLRAGRATRWVNTDVRALVLEPGFIWLLFLKGLWRRLTTAAPAPPRTALIVVGDRFTADVIEHLHERSRAIILAGATQPGRALLGGVRLQPDSMPIESFTDWADPFRWFVADLEATTQALGLAMDGAHARRFTIDGVGYWPLVRGTVCLHVLMWVPALRHLQSLAARAARACPDARLLTPTDVTAYNRVLIDTVRRFGVPSIGIQHGINGEPNGHSVVHVDTLAVWGEATEPWYRNLAIQSATFAVTGNPRFDSLASRIPNPEPRTPFTVTVCTGFMSDFSVGASEYENLLMIDSVLAWAKTRDDVRVIHKMHPGEEVEYYADAARALGWDPLKLTTIREPILYDVLEKSHVLVAAYSTTILESIALGTPAIVFDTIVQRMLLPLDKIPGVTIAYSIAQLHQQLDTRRTSPRPDPQSLRNSPELHAYITGLDGHATDRVAALLG